MYLSVFVFIKILAQTWALAILPQVHTRYAIFLWTYLELSQWLIEERLVSLLLDYMFYHSAFHVFQTAMALYSKLQVLGDSQGENYYRNVDNCFNEQ